MAYNKTEHLRLNIEALRIAFALEREGRTATADERYALQAYSGFGAIKEVLKPLPPQKRTALTPLIEELHALLKECTPDQRAYKRYADGIKSSVLTAFYTPLNVTDVIAQVICANANLRRVLEPSAGTGVFVDVTRYYSPDAEITCFEKDPATGLILKHLYPETEVRIEGYERIASDRNDYYDLAVSNIPFGDIATFDPAFSTDRDPVRRQGARSLHNYFFMKSVDTVRKGGLIAFITSQGVTDAARNKPIREWLMQRCDLVSAVRLPNNLFIDHAGTEVGSDLIILQKNSATRPLTERQRNFIQTRTLSNGIAVNNSFQDLDRVVQTTAKVGTNPYGQPAMEFIHSGGVAGIAEALGRMLREDFGQYYNRSLYDEYAQEVTAAQMHTQTEIPHPQIIQTHTEPQVQSPHVAIPDGLFDAPPYPPDLDPFWQAIEDHWFPDEKAFFSSQEPIQASMSTPHPESESRSKATNAPPVIESVLPLSDDTRLASGTNGPRRVGELLGTVIADLKQKSLRHQKQTNKLHGGVFDQQPDLTWHATEQEWREFNEWAQSRMAVTEAASHGLWLDPETGELTKIEKEQIAEELSLIHI